MAPLAIQLFMEAVNQGMNNDFARKACFFEATLFGLCCATRRQRGRHRSIHWEKQAPIFRADNIPLFGEPEKLCHGCYLL